MKNRGISLVTLLLLLAVVLAACDTGGSRRIGSGEPKGEWGQPLVDSFSEQRIEENTMIHETILEPSAAAAELGLKLLRNANAAEENTLISPLSVLYALGMAMNGAEGETLSQMENTLGVAQEALGAWLEAYRKNLDEHLHLANGMWVRDDPEIQISDEFLRRNIRTSGTELYKAPFDKGTCRDINQWVEKHTDGMIHDILDEISDDAFLYLVNALSFEAEWPVPYSENRVVREPFHTADGEEVEAEYLCGKEYDTYLSGELADGFYKPYRGGRYAFGALLPREGVTIAELLSSLDGEALIHLLSHPEEGTTVIQMPKFETGYAVELSDVLSEIGMSCAFDADKADFSSMGKARGNIYLSRVLHKTYMSLGERGTRAGASTVVEVYDECCIEEIKEVILNRPFLYFLVDLQNNTPLFMGTMLDPAPQNEAR